ncbi:MAG TPA: Rieske 2Fe-2S domain-containing protein [Thermoanaerobaculaceae bacterium]|nr:Rieske 2Fe-2S domain-containing protein [Thermoanaerobaculaceae bacterium]
MSDEAPTLHRIASVAEIPARGLAFSVRIGAWEESGILVHDGEAIRAWRNRCRHLAVPLDHETPGEFFTPDGSFLMCQQHGALYRPGDGLCVWGPCRQTSLRPLSIVVRGGEVFLDPGSGSSADGSSQAVP